MSKGNPKVDPFFRGAGQWREEMKALRTIVLGCGLTEELKWGKPCYTFQDHNVVLIIGFKAYCSLLFCKGALLKDRQGLLVKAGENTQAARQLRFTHLKEILAREAVVKSYVNEAVAAEKAGLQVAYQPPAAFPIPEELQKRLDESPALKAAFGALTPGRRRAYNMYFSAPKQSQTRESRVEKCVPKILQGQGLNDDYRRRKA